MFLIHSQTNRAQVEVAGHPHSAELGTQGWFWHLWGVAASPGGVSASLTLTSGEADSAATGDPETKWEFSMRVPRLLKGPLLAGRKSAGQWDSKAWGWGGGPQLCSYAPQCCSSEFPGA